MNFVAKINKLELELELYGLNQGYSTSVSKSPDLAHETSLGPRKLRKLGKDPEYMENKIRLKTPPQKKRSSP